MTLILGIETSCDETSVSVVKDGRKILSNIVSSSKNFHAKYGGVIPEIASRFHLETIVGVAEEALSEARTELDDIDLIAVTREPGLLSSLLVGVSFARALSFSRDIPLINVDHIKAHLWAIYLEQDVKLPAIGLVVSGGHTSLVHMKAKNNFIVLGSTLDDAVGETFDKVATILGLDYPGGPIIDRLAKKGNPGRFKFSCAELPGSLDFSFSGIKTAVLYFVRKQSLVPALPAGRHSHGLLGRQAQSTVKTNRGPSTIDRRLISDIAASFQNSVVDILVKKTLLACAMKKIKRVIVGGGVAANSFLRQNLTREAKARGIEVYFPSVNLCLDNAAMIAGLGFQLYKGRSG